MTLVLENIFNLLMIMPSGHGKLVMFMIPPMVIGRTVATLLWPSVGVKPNTWKK
jgi:hypothetical protein